MGGRRIHTDSQSRDGRRRTERISKVILFWFDDDDQPKKKVEKLKNDKKLEEEEEEVKLIGEETIVCNEKEREKMKCNFKGRQLCGCGLVVLVVAN